MPSPFLRYRERSPDAALRPFIECVWMVWDPHPRPARPAEQVVPDGCPEVILHFGDPFARLVSGRWRRQSRAFLAGTLSRPWTLRAGRRVNTLGIRFRPGAFTAFFPTRMDDHVDREVPLSRFMPRARVRDLLGRCGGARAPAARMRAAETWLAAQASGGDAWMRGLSRAAVRILLRSRGGTRIEKVARQLGVTRRRLERSFARDLGIRPKLYARIVRLNAALLGLRHDALARAVDVALEAGYFDQAHLSRDFRAVAGRTARRQEASEGDLSRHLTRPERLLAMLAGE